MGEIITKPTDRSIDEFLSAIEPEKKRIAGFELKKIFDTAIKEKPVLWSNNMIGYGSYHYKSERSTQEGDWPLTGFSPRKSYMAVYIMHGVNRYEALLKKLGKFKVSSGSCLYINKLEDIDIEVLKELISTSVKDMKKAHGVE